MAPSLLLVLVQVFLFSFFFFFPVFLFCFFLFLYYFDFSVKIGIDTGLFLVQLQYSRDVALQSKKIMEYNWNEDPTEYEW